MKLFTIPSPDPCIANQDIRITTSGFKNSMAEKWFHGQVTDGRTCKLKISAYPKMNKKVVVTIRSESTIDIKMIFMPYSTFSEDKFKDKDMPQFNQVKNLQRINS